MKIKPILLLKMSVLLVAVCLILSCVKTNNLDFDTKVRFVNTIDEKPQDFYLNEVKSATGISYSANSDYVVAAGDKEYNIFAKNTTTQSVSSSVKYSLKVGRNYSVYYLKKSAMDSVLNVMEDDLTPDTANARLFFINLGYTLGSRVSIRNETSNPVNITLGNGENSGYIKIPTGKNSRLYFNLIDSAQVIDTISYTNFFKGKTYTIIIDGVNKGASKGKLKERLIANN
ncbi:DUF4397 domain-containing protein [Pedobacter rhodius]|uniref:DUF4397 domain-containing protein n=1 Tax=Pedobacter rhodius TaxID=3004098 RepID=A0ABT4KXG2_9SPHI|nr:DUF4397 domain-containing protein [Pedobacter sp. SJ11]MCZ4223620.1 DUF4397 domain-containing protein [Pedobacter sp. SJ11]